MKKNVHLFRSAVESNLFYYGRRVVHRARTMSGPADIDKTLIFYKTLYYDVIIWSGWKFDIILADAVIFPDENNS